MTAPRSGAPSSTTVEHCANSGATIGRLQTPYVWKDQTVCGACHPQLVSEAQPAYASRATLAAAPMKTA